MEGTQINVPMGTRVRNPHEDRGSLTWFIGEQRHDGSLPLIPVDHPESTSIDWVKPHELLESNPKLLTAAVGPLAIPGAGDAADGGWRVVSAPSSRALLKRGAGEEAWAGLDELTKLNGPFDLRTVEPVPSDPEASSLIARQRGARVMLFDASEQYGAHAFLGTEATATGDARAAARTVTNYLDWLHEGTGRAGLDGSRRAVSMVLNSADDPGNAHWSGTSTSTGRGSVVFGVDADSTPVWRRSGVVPHELTHGLQEAMLGKIALSADDLAKQASTGRLHERASFEALSVNEALSDVGGALNHRAWRPGADSQHPSVQPDRDIPKLLTGSNPMVHDKTGLDAFWTKYSNPVVDAVTDLPIDAATHYDTSTIVSHAHYRIQQHIGWKQSDQLFFSTLDEMATHLDAGRDFQAWANAARRAAHTVLGTDVHALTKVLTEIARTGF